MNNIIKFDFRKVVTEPKDDPIQRMKAAVAEMAKENTEFQDKMVGFREIMGELDQQMDKLGNSCQDFQRSLDRIRVGAGSLRKRSLWLASAMDV